MQQFDREAIGRRIALARHERGLTQDELAALASFSKRALQEYEGGVRIPYKHMDELHRLLGKPTEWFLYGDQQEQETVATELLGQVAEELSTAQHLLRRIAEAVGLDVDGDESQEPPRAL